jgi:hypothetical protein
MRKVAGEFARAYNRRKGRPKAFWGDNFHGALVENGRYLWRCLCYVELNMVCCGAVSHPRVESARFPGRTWGFTEWRPRHAAWQSGRHGGAAIGELIVRREVRPERLEALAPSDRLG